MKEKRSYISLLTLLSLLTLSSCFDLEEELYDHVEKKDYYSDSESLLAGLLRPYEYVKQIESEAIFWLQELSADQLVITQKRDHWEDGGIWRMLHQHTWDAYEQNIETAWNNCYAAIGYCNNMLEDIAGLNYAGFGLTADDKAQHQAELTVLRAYIQWILLDLYGIPALSLSTKKPFVTQDTEENFNFIEESILSSIDFLPVAFTQNYEGRITRGTAAMILMRLYLNASWYIDRPMWEETKEVALKLLNGAYGDYSVTSDWTDLWDAENRNCKEVVWAFPQARQYNYSDFYYLFFMHYNAYERFNCGADFPMAFNGCHLSPSYDPAGRLYEYRLGSPFHKFPDTDFRKREFKVLSQGKYEGLFLYGPQYTYGTTTLQTGVEEWGNYTLVYLDQVAHYGENLKGTGKADLLSALLSSDKPYVVSNDQFSSLPSHIKTGEENSGIRIVKYPLFPSGDPAVKSSDQIVFRFSEVYYTLAEVEFRTGNHGEAERILNTIRKRYYTDEEWLQVCYPEDGSVLTEQELLDEWGREFIAEKRRRTDLNRFGVFCKEKWWDKEPSEKYRKFYPVPANAILSNPALRRSEGYTY